MLVWSAIANASFASDLHHPGRRRKRGGPCGQDVEDVLPVVGQQCDHQRGPPALRSIAHVTGSLRSARGHRRSA